MTRDTRIRMRYGEKVMPLLLCALAVAPASAQDEAEVAPDAPSADALYLEALAAWRDGQTRTTLTLARRALAAANGVHPHAELLLAYAELRSGDRAEAIRRLTALADAPAAPPAIRDSARRALERATARSQRSAWSLHVGGQVAGRWSGEVLVPGLGYSFGVDWPFFKNFGVAAELSGYDTSAGSPFLEGPVVDVLASAHVPFGGSAWALNAKVGPAVWLASGALYGDATVPSLGVRATAGFDVRPWTTVGLYVNAGGWVWPGFVTDLPTWSFTWDLRTGLVIWFPAPKPAPASGS